MYMNICLRTAERELCTQPLTVVTDLSALSMGARVLLALVSLVVLVNTVSAEKAPGERNLKLDSEIIAANRNNKASGIFRITNNGRSPVTIGKLLYDIRFSETVTYDSTIGNVHKDDIRQRFVQRSCGSVKLPMVLQPGAKLDCPFSTRENIYKGAIDIVAAAVDAKAADTMTGTYTAFDILKLPDPRITGLDANVPPCPEASAPAAVAPPTYQGRTYRAKCDTSITGGDIECGYRHNTGPRKFCKVCGGRAEVEERCNQIPICTAYVMEVNTDCGYLKKSGGTEKGKDKGFVTFYLASGRPGH